jgi:hypothetical protein
MSDPERRRFLQMIREIDRDPREVRAAKPITQGTLALNNKIQEALTKLAAAYRRSCEDRRKAAIYGYLRAVYELGLHFEGRGQDSYLMERAGVTGWPNPRKGEGLLPYLLRATSTANRKTRCKWGHALVAAHERGESAGDLEHAITSVGGLENYARKWASGKGSCARISRAVEEGENEGAQEVDDGDDGWGDDAALAYVGQKAFLPPSEISHRAPATVRVPLKEANNCFRVQAFTATVFMCSFVLQRTCMERGFEAFEIAPAIDVLGSWGLIDPIQLKQVRESAVEVVKTAQAGKAAIHREQAHNLLQITHTIVASAFPL